MPEINISLSEAVTYLTQAMNRQSLVLISEPHSDPDGFTLARRIVGNIQGNHSKRLLLEAPDTLNHAPNFTKSFSDWSVEPDRTFGSINASAMQVLVRTAKAASWDVRAVDSQPLTTTSRRNDPNGVVRQSYIAENVRQALRASTGCILTIGTAHILGNSGTPRMHPLTKILTDRDSYSGITQYRVGVTKQYKKGILVHVIPKSAVASYAWNKAVPRVQGINTGAGSFIDIRIKGARVGPGITSNTSWN